MIEKQSDMQNYPALCECQCPLGCDRGDDTVLNGIDRLHGLPGIFTVVRCRGCGLMRTNPRPNTDTIGYYYPESYGPHQTLHTQPIKNEVGFFRKILHRALDPRTRAIPELSPGRMLEVGSATGDFLDEMRGRGWDVFGIEFSEHAAKISQDKGLSVHVGVIGDFPEPSARYNLIAGWMVLEHLHEPVAELSKLREFVEEDGYLTISIPDASSLEFKLFRDAWYALQLPTHLFHYTPKTITKIMEASGWRVEKVMWHRNAANLLHSLSYIADDHGWNKLAIFITDVARGNRFNRFRLLLGLFLGVCRQSGRMTIWARPVAK